FRAEANWFRNYGDGEDANRLVNGVPTGYYTPSGGSDSAHFQTLFFRLMPRVTDNDNVYLNSEWWLGTPVFGFFGDSVPYTIAQRQWYATQVRGATCRAQRLWADAVTDVGTIQMGRAPLDWGLGLIWDSGDGVFDRYQPTGDTVRLIAKFGAFSFSPSLT